MRKELYRPGREVIAGDVYYLDRGGERRNKGVNPSFLSLIGWVVQAIAVVFFGLIVIGFSLMPLEVAVAFYIKNPFHNMLATAGMIVFLVGIQCGLLAVNPLLFPGKE